jgi:hypothetical protein
MELTPNGLPACPPNHQCQDREGGVFLGLVRVRSLAYLTHGTSSLGAICITPLPLQTHSGPVPICFRERRGGEEEDEEGGRLGARWRYASFPPPAHCVREDHQDHPQARPLSPPARWAEFNEPPSTFTETLHQAAAGVLLTLRDGGTCRRG